MQSAQPSIPRQKYGKVLLTKMAEGDAGVAIIASIVPRSHSRANTRLVIMQPVSVSTITKSPGTKYQVLMTDSLNQMRGTTTMPAPSDSPAIAMPAAPETALTIMVARGASIPSTTICRDTLEVFCFSKTANASISKLSKAFRASLRAT